MFLPAQSYDYQKYIPHTMTKTLQNLAACGLLTLIASVAGAQTAPSTNEETVKLEAYTVTGSNIPRLEQENVLPISTFSSLDLENIGAPTMAEVLEALPYSQNININEGETGANGARGDVASVNLRNLGAGNTLVLLNGRRMSAHGVTPGTPPVSFVNLSSIPVSAIDQIEVLRDGASAIYGSDAIGGVINTRLKSTYTGFDLSTRLSNGDPSRKEISVEVGGGKIFNGGKTSLSLFISYFDRDPLYALQRSYSAMSDNRLIAPEPWASLSTLNRSSSSSPYGRFTAVDDAGNSVGVSGVTPTSGSTRGRFYVDPVTGAIKSSTGPSANYDFQNEGQLIPQTTRYNLYSTLNHQISDQLSFFGELSYYTADSLMQSGTTPISSGTDGVIISKTGYYNPVGTRFYGPGTANPTGTPRNVLIRNYRPVELGARTFNTSNKSVRLVGGFKGTVFDNWNYETAALYMRGTSYLDSQNAMSQSKLEAALALPTSDAMNPFGGPNVNSQATIDKFRITAWDEGVGTLSILDAKANGVLYELPGGDVATAFGVEFRKEEMQQRNDAYGLADDIIAQSEQIDIDASRDVYAGYAEVLVPIVGKQNSMPGVYRMEFRVAGRYEDFGKESALKPGLGFSWAFTDWLMLRASYNEGFRAAAVTELYQPQRGRRNFLFDDARIPEEDASDTISKLVITGGNPNLKPEESKAHNLGLVVDVKPVKGLSFGVDIYNIKQANRIDNPDPQAELNLDARLWAQSKGSNSRVIREAQTPSDVTQNIPGKLISVQGTYQNLASREVGGVDAVLMYRVPTTSLGRFTLRSEASYTSKLESVDADGNISRLIRQTASPRTKGTGSLSWAKNNWSAATVVKYVSDYEDASNYDIAGQPWIIEAWTTVNVNLGYRFKTGMLKGTRLRVGANNVFDKDPPLVVSTSDAFDASYADARGRMVWVQADYKF